MFFPIEQKQIVSVKPFNIPEYNNKVILSLLKKETIHKDRLNNFDDEKPLLNYSIPTYNDKEVDEKIKINNRRLFYESKQEKKRSNENFNKCFEKSILNKIKNDTENNDFKLNYYVDLKEFLPKNLHDQLSVVILLNFLELKKVFIEKILEIMINSLNEDIKFSWSTVNSKLIGRIIVYVRFEYIEDVKLFIDFYKDQISKLLDLKEISLIYNKKIHNFIKETKLETNENKLDLLIYMKIKFIVENYKSFQKNSSNSDTKELNEVLKYYNDYKIDENELIDVPNNMRETIVKDIIKFRSKVLILERKNREKELELERIKTKNRLTKLFKDINEVGEQKIEDHSDEKGKNNFFNDTHKNISDDVDTHNNSIYKSDKEIFLEKLDLFKTQVKEITCLREKLNNSNNYEKYLIKNKSNFIELIKNFQNYESYVDYISKYKYDKHYHQFVSIFKLYYTNHSHYVKVRAQKKSMESEKDLMDIDDEKQNEDEKITSITSFPTESANNKKDLKFTLPQEIIIDKKSDSEIKISEIDSEKKEKLQQKISDLVEENLGIKDEFLINSINENLLKNDLNAKTELINELFEILDEDSKNLVNDLWSFILNELLVNN